MSYDCRGVKATSSQDILLIFSDILFWKFTMVLKRAQVDNLVTEELIEESLKFPVITNRLISLNSRFEDFIKIYDKLSSELLISKNCNSLRLRHY